MNKKQQLGMEENPRESGLVDLCQSSAPALVEDRDPLNLLVLLRQRTLLALGEVLGAAGHSAGLLGGD